MSKAISRYQSFLVGMFNFIVALTSKWDDMGKRCRGCQRDIFPTNDSLTPLWPLCTGYRFIPADHECHPRESMTISIIIIITIVKTITNTTVIKISIITYTSMILATIMINVVININLVIHFTCKLVIALVSEGPEQQTHDQTVPRRIQLQKFYCVHAFLCTNFFAHVCLCKNLAV